MLYTHRSRGTSAPNLPTGLKAQGRARARAVPKSKKIKTVLSLLLSQLLL
jgi:hypothetical protein